MLGDEDKTQDRSGGPAEQPAGWTAADSPAADMADTVDHADTADATGQDRPAEAGQSPDPVLDAAPPAPAPGPPPPPAFPGHAPGPAVPPSWGTGPYAGPSWQGPSGWQPPQQPQQWQQPVWRPEGWQGGQWQQAGWQQPGPQPGWPPSPQGQIPGQAPQSWSWRPPTASTSPSGSPRRSRLPVVLSVIAACLISFSGGMVFDHFAFAPTTTVTAQPTASDGTVTSLPALYQQTQQIIKKYFVGRDSVTDQQLLYGALKGMLQALGDTGHSVFLTPSEYQAYQASLNATVAGIGVLMSDNNSALTITKVLSGTPAASAGVKAGDRITAVDGVSTAGWTLDQLGSKVRGTPGTTVKITVARAGASAPIDFTITRAQVSVPLVGWGMIPGTHIADIALVEFSTGASDQVAAAIAEAKKAGATSLILDLRGNPGGYASEATDVASQFLASGTVYIEEDANGQQTRVNVNPKVASNALPMVALVDHDSASSSEIVAGALQDHQRARIVGVATYGTGTVLQKFTLDDGSVIFLGTADWLTPNGNRIFGKGITPDQLVGLPAGSVPLDPTALGAMTTTQLEASGDAQLLAAVAGLK
jgi:carboxyl-terminal processing protease